MSKQRKCPWFVLMIRSNEGINEYAKFDIYTFLNEAFNINKHHPVLVAVTMYDMTPKESEKWFEQVVSDHQVKTWTTHYNGNGQQAPKEW